MYGEEVKLNKTTRLLYWSMFELLENDLFDDITVNDICKRALISRSTFYSYFQDKYHLVIFSLQQERERLGLIRGENIKENTITFLTNIKEKENVYRNLLLGQTNRELNKMFFAQMSEGINYIILKKF